MVRVYDTALLIHTINGQSQIWLVRLFRQTNKQTQDQGNEMWKSADLKKGGTPDTAQFNDQVYPGAFT